MHVKAIIHIKNIEQKQNSVIIQGNSVTYKLMKMDA